MLGVQITYTCKCKIYKGTVLFMYVPPPPPSHATFISGHVQVDCAHVVYLFLLFFNFAVCSSKTISLWR